MGIREKLHLTNDFNLFLAAGLLAGVGTGIYNSIFNNYLSDVFMLSEDVRGFLEVPREAPGLLIVFVLAALSAFGDVRIAVFGMAIAGVGLLGLGIMSPFFGLMMLWMMLYSLGTHMIMPVTPSIGMALSSQESFGTRLGTISAYGLIGNIAAYIVIFVGFHYMNTTYQPAFVIGAVFYLLAAVIIALMKKDTGAAGKEAKTARFIFRKRYMLFYFLSAISGARQQIFMTFAPWVLIKIFDVKAQTFAILGIVVAFVSMGARTLIGRLIDSHGERFVLTVEAVFLLAICLGYAFSDKIFTDAVAVVIIAGCYVIDCSISAVSMARSTYLRKIAVDVADVTPTLSTGVSLQHVASMVIPAFGGILWIYAGFEAVFMAAAVIALLNLILSRKISI